MINKKQSDWYIDALSNMSSMNNIYFKIKIQKKKYSKNLPNFSLKQSIYRWMNKKPNDFQSLAFIIFADCSSI